MSGSLKAKSDKCWELADSLRSAKDFNNCASRMYYSIFQAVVHYAVIKERYSPAETLERKLNAHKLMNRVVERVLPAAKDLYEDMRELRNKADYDPEDVSAAEIDQTVFFRMQGIRESFLKEAAK